MADRPRKSKRPDALVPDLHVSRRTIDDPTSAFPIGALAGKAEELDDDAVEPITPPAAAKKKAGPRTDSAAGGGFSPVVGGIDLRWLAVSLLAGGVLAVFVVAFFGLVVVFVR